MPRRIDLPDHPETIWAYAAGIIDGEGSIYIRGERAASTKGRHHQQLYLSVRGTDAKLGEWLKAQFGGFLYWPKMGGWKPQWKPCWMWTTSANRAEQLLRRTMPYLVIKRPQALIALRFRETFMDDGQARDVPDDVWADRFSFREEIKRLNQRGVAV